VRKPGDEFGTRTETKNVNSVRFIQAVVEYEAKRQVEVIEGGGAIRQETRLWDPDKGVTRSMRSKEDAHDYRYFPDPDLLPLELTEAFVADCKASLPELPDAKRTRFERQFSLSTYQAEVLTAEQKWALFFEKVCEGLIASDVAAIEAGKASANLIINEIFGFLKSGGFEDGIDIVSGEPIQVIGAEQAANLLRLRIDGTVSGPLYKQLFERIAGTSDDPKTVANNEGFLQTSDTGAIEAVIAEVLSANADKVAQFRDGKEALFGFFVGQTMKAMGGKANPGVVNELLRKALA
jgi:aspartyl-tRNA(Asn)/glutamyl-tRNA(Gln) amidotransferase subunit B